MVSSEECLRFLKYKNGVFLGVEGVLLVFVQKRTMLPVGFDYASFDEESKLYKDDKGKHLVPTLHTRRSSYSFALGLHWFKEFWLRPVVLLFQ
jgi:hypothetical protein